MSEYLSAGELHQLTGLQAWQQGRRDAMHERLLTEAQQDLIYKAARPAREKAAKERALALRRQRSAKRRASERLRSPAWADLTKVQEVYKLAVGLTIKTGVAHHVDHIYPLCGELVSGLHVHQNLQVLLAVENMQKHNKFEVV